jgi:hypothetical protein
MMSASFKSLELIAMLRIQAQCAVLLLILSALSAETQAQSSATVSLERVVMNAGEMITGNLTLDVAPTCNGHLGVDFVSDSTPHRGGLGLTGTTRIGNRVVLVLGQTSFDDPGGAFTSGTATFQCDGYRTTHPLTLSDKLHITIVPVPDTNAYPTRVRVELNVSQKQFLETKAHEVDDLLIRFANGIQKYPSTTQVQKDFLVSVIDAAQSALNDAEKEYRKQVLKSDQSLPIFFEDFREHYQDLRTEVRAPKAAGALESPHLVLAQLKKRPNQQKPSNSLTPDAEATQHLLEDNKRAYKYVEETGGAIFTTELISIPAGARVSYRRTTQPDFIDYATLTNVTAATFPMAYLAFKFHKDNCGEDQYLRIDPWDDPKAPIEMEFTKCR